MTTPSQTPEAAGLEAEKRLAGIAAAVEFGRGNGIHFLEEGAVILASDIRSVLVTAASAQAAIDAEKARADRLARFGQHTNWELSHGYPDGEEEDGCWLVHSVNGGRNDREWTLIGRGETPDDAIRAALQQETQK